MFVMKNSPQEITMMDFTPEAVSKAVKDAALNPVTRYAPAIGAASCFGAWLFSLTLFYWVGGVLLVIGAANGTLRKFLLRDKIALKYQRMKREAIEALAARETAELEAHLSDMGEERAAKQIILLKKCYLRFRDKLQTQIDQETPEYNQYVGNAEVMYLSALNNLRKVSQNTLDLKTIDVEDSKARIEELKADKSRDDIDEIAAHQRKIDIEANIIQNSKDLVAEVAETITTLTDITVSLSDIKATKDSLNDNLEQARRKFQHIHDRNKKIYDRVAKSWEDLQARY